MVSPANVFMMDVLGLDLPEAERQGALERPGVAFSHQLVAGGTSLLLRAFGAEEVAETRRPTYKFAPSGEFEPLGDGLLGLLHRKSGRKQRSGARLARGNSLFVATSVSEWSVAF